MESDSILSNFRTYAKNPLHHRYSKCLFECDSLFWIAHKQYLTIQAQADMDGAAKSEQKAFDENLVKKLLEQANIHDDFLEFRFILLSYEI